MRHLDLDGNQLTDAGLAELAKFQNLESLSVSGNPQITDAGLLKLSSLTKLQFLAAIQTAVTSDGVSQLQRLLPNCRIRN